MGRGGGLPGCIRFLILLVPEPISRASLVDALIHLSCTGCTRCTYSCKYSCTQELMYSCAHVLMCSCTQVLMNLSTHLLNSAVFMYLCTHEIHVFKVSSAHVHMYSCPYVLTSARTHIILILMSSSAHVLMYSCTHMLMYSCTR